MGLEEDCARGVGDRRRARRRVVPGRAVPRSGPRSGFPDEPPDKFADVRLVRPRNREDHPEIERRDDSVQHLLQRRGRGCVASLPCRVEYGAEALSDPAQTLTQSLVPIVDVRRDLGAEERDAAGPGEFGQRPNRLVLQVGAQVSDERRRA